MLAIPYYDWIAHHAGRRPAKLAIHDLQTGRKFTYADLDRAVQYSWIIEPAIDDDLSDLLLPQFLGNGRKAHQSVDFLLGDQLR